MSGIGEIDAQLRATVIRRDDARDRLVAALIDLDQCDQWLQRLLEQRNEAGTT